MIGFDEFVKKIYALKVKGEVEVGLLPPNRRTAISTLQIALNRRYTSRTENGKTTVWRLK